MKLTSLPLKDESGFTLLEVLISVVILAIGLLGVAALQMVAIQGNSFGSKLSVATEQIESTIERYRNMPFDDIANENIAAADNNGYAIQSAVVDNSPIDDTKTVTVTVTWNDKEAGDNSRDITFRTIIAR